MDDSTRWGLSGARAARAALIALFGVAFGGTTLLACGDDGGGGAGGGGTKCGGLELADGTCVAKCDPELCLPGNTCVNNVCVLTCTGHGDCSPGQVCSPAIEDDTEAAIATCQLSEKSGFIGMLCPFGNECDGLFTCPSGESCGQSVCGGQACTANPELCPSDRPDCKLGTCPDGSVCVVPPCPAEQCRPLTCLSAGMGDADAICINHDCQSNADCAPGFYCGLTRDAHKVCGTTKGVEDPCIDPAANQNGETFQEGPISLLRNTCLPMRPCVGCETDLDCSPLVAWDSMTGAVVPRGQAMRCSDVAGAKVCAPTCLQDGDCEPDYACVVEEGVCKPRFGSCTGSGGFCEPCIDDFDCGDKNSSVYCRSISGFQRACFDGSFPDTCTTDSNCPQSPSGLYGECLDQGEGLAPEDDLFHYCYLPYDSGSSKFGCWGP